MNHFVGVGACYIDTILSVPHFLIEDEKLRASSVVRRRGGNCANTIEVLQQLLGVAQGASRPANTPAVSLNLLAVLPHDSSPAVQLIQDSLGPEVSLATCIYRDAHIDAASSYIIKNVASGSRTIISHSDLPEMTCDEFVRVVGSFHRSRGIVRGEEMWYHFEGRIPDVTLACIRHLRNSFPEVTISVELENPTRRGLQDLVAEADVVFYSKSWAVGNGYHSAEECLRAQAKFASRAHFLCCTWGDQGASALEPATLRYFSVPAHGSQGVSPVIDTIGAGDTFLAGMIYTSLTGTTGENAFSLEMEKRLGFANELAGRKVLQDGFGWISGIADLIAQWT